MSNTQLATLNRVTEAQVRAEKAPAFTDSWRPFSHAQILDAMAVAVKDAHLDIVARDYSMREESKMIACWEVKTDSKEFNFGISILNSIDKSHAVTLGCFERTFICSNFMFRMEYERVMFRKHSGSLELDEVIFLAKGALKLLIPKFENLKSWHAGMKDVKMTAEQSAFVTVAALKRGLIPPAKSPEFLDLFIGPESKYKEYGGSLYAWHGAATELMNDNSILTIVAKQDRLNYFVDYEVPILMKKGHDRAVDFKAIEKTAFAQYNAEKGARKEETKKAFATVRDEFKATKDAGKIAERTARKAEREKARAEKKAERDAKREAKRIAREAKRAEKDAKLKAKADVAVKKILGTEKASATPKDVKTEKKVVKATRQGRGGSKNANASDQSIASAKVVAPTTSPTGTDVPKTISATRKTSGKTEARIKKDVAKVDELRKMRERDAKKIASLNAKKDA